MDDEAAAIQTLTQLYLTDQAAFDSVVQAARDAGEDRPKNLSERMGAGFLGHRGGSFSNTPLARQRLLDSLPHHARIGATAYVRGGPGNSYTDFLKARFGSAR